MNDWSTICIRLLGKQQLTRSDILRGPLLLTLISESSMEFKEWISNHVQIKIWHVITHPCLYVRDGWVIATHYKIWGVITYPCPMRTHYAQKYNQENGTTKDPTYPHPTHPIHTHIPMIYSPAHYNWYRKIFFFSGYGFTSGSFLMISITFYRFYSSQTVLIQSHYLPTQNTKFQQQRECHI